MIALIAVLRSTANISSLIDCSDAWMISSVNRSSTTPEGSARFDAACAVCARSASPPLGAVSRSRGPQLRSPSEPTPVTSS